MGLPATFVISLQIESVVMLLFLSTSFFISISPKEEKDDDVFARECVHACVFLKYLMNKKNFQQSIIVYTSTTNELLESAWFNMAVRANWS